MRGIGVWLHRFGYYGSCGADILETAPTSDEYRELSNMFIVDLNVRTSGSLVLGLMKQHFSEPRGLREASIFALDVSLARDSFVTHFEKYFRDDDMVIISWYEDAKSGASSGNIVIGGRNKLELEKRVAMVKELTSEVYS